MNDNDRYNKAAHAMQSGVATMMQYDPEETQPKHLRVGINVALSDQAGLVNILIKKGIFTLEEYTKSLADQMEKEKESYEKELSAIVGTKISLI